MVVHRRDKFRAAPRVRPSSSSSPTEGRIEMVVPYQLDALDGSGGQIFRRAVQGLDGKVRRLEAGCAAGLFRPRR